VKREEAETIKREAYEAIIEMCETRANLFPAHSELIIHMVAGDMQEICRLARLGLRVKWPSEADQEAMSDAVRVALDLRSRRISRPPVGHGNVLAEPSQAQTAVDAALSALTEQQ
jgi:hypothetical protein